MRSKLSGWAGTYRTFEPLPRTRRWGTPWRLWRSRTRRPQSSSHRSPWCRNVARMARSRLPLRVSAGGASKSARAWPSPKAGVLPSLPSALGRLTPRTGLWLTAFTSQRWSKSEATAASLRRMELGARPRRSRSLKPGEQVGPAKTFVSTRGKVVLSMTVLLTRDEVLLALKRGSSVAFRRITGKGSFAQRRAEVKREALKPKEPFVGQGSHQLGGN